MPVGTAAPETALRPIAQVAVEARVGSQTGLFDYAVPEALTGLIEVGHRVRVPFGKRTVTGFVYALDQGPTVLELKPIEALLDAEPVLPSPLVELAGFGHVRARQRRHIVCGRIERKRTADERCRAAMIAGFVVEKGQVDKRQRHIGPLLHDLLGGGNRAAEIAPLVS